MDVTARPPIIFKRGSGSYLWDQDGKKYLDFVQGWAVNCLGHCPANVAKVISEQSRELITPSPAFFNEPSIQLARILVENSCLQRVFFANSGAEANEGAIKLTRKWGELNKNGAYEIITFVDGFHGRTLATMSASGKPHFEKLFEPKVEGFPKAKLNDIKSVAALITPNTVAVMLEPVQGEAGVRIAENSFLQELQQLTRNKNILLILDEIQTGVGRTGTLWGYQHSGITPDIITLGKMLGGGVPLAALLATERVSCFEHGDQGGTFNGNPLMTAVGRAVMESVVKPGFLQNVSVLGGYITKRLSELSVRFGLGEVRGRGLLIALDLNRSIGSKIVEESLVSGLIINAPRPDILRFMPALNVETSEVDEMVEILGDVFARILAPPD